MITRPRCCERVGAPVPHVERVDAVVGVARPVEVDVPGIGGEGLLVLRLDLEQVGRLGEHLLEEVDVARVVDRVERPRRRVRDDHHAALAHERLAAVEVEEVAEAEAGDEDRVHDRVDVVGADVGQPHRQTSVWPATCDELLAVDVGERGLVHGLDLAGLHRGEVVGRDDGVEDLAGEPARGPLERGRGRVEAGPVPERPLPFALLQEAELLGERVGVERRLDLEDLHARLGDQPPHAPVRGVQLGVVHVHERAAVLHRAHVVVVPDAAVGGEPGRDGLVPAVHGDEVDVHVDEQVALGRAAVDLDVLAVVGEPEVDEVRRVLGVVLEQQAVRRERLEDAVAEGVAELGVGHPAVEGERGDQHDVVDAGLGGQVEDRLDHPLAHVGGAHRREGERDVVEGDREPHARETAACAAAASRRAGCRGRGGSPRRDRRAGRAARARRRPGSRREAARAGSPRRARSASAESSGRPRGRSRASGSLCLLGRVRPRPAFRTARRRTRPSRVAPLRRSNTIFTAPRRPAAAAWRRPPRSAREGSGPRRDARGAPRARARRRARRSTVALSGRSSLP